MTPKEFKFLFQTIVQTGHHFYRRGEADAKAGKSLKDNEFKLTPGTQLKIKKELANFLKNG